MRNEPSNKSANQKKTGLLNRSVQEIYYHFPTSLAMACPGNK